MHSSMGESGPWPKRLVHVRGRTLVAVCGRRLGLHACGLAGQREAQLQQRHGVAGGRACGGRKREHATRQGLGA